MTISAFNPALRLFQLLRRCLWRFTGRPAGVHAIPVTPSGRIVLVRLTYARGWRLPGGGYKRGEEPRAAMLRELREEIGLTGHGAVEEVEAYRSGEDREEGEGGSLFMVRDVAYAPRSNFEVAEVREFDPAALPPDVAPRWRPWLEGQAGRIGSGA